MTNTFNEQNNDTELAAAIKAATNFSLDDATRLQTRAFLFEYTRFHPIRTKQQAAAKVRRMRGIFVRIFHPMPIMALALILTVGGGTAWASESALPGDILYPVKVNVTEELQGAIASSPQAQADWAIQRAERRIEEAAALAQRGTLDDKKRAIIDSHIEKHVAVAAVQSQKLESENDLGGAAEVQASLSAALLAHESALNDASGDVQDEESRTQMSAVIKNVSARAKVAIEGEGRLSAKIARNDVANTSDSVVAIQRKAAARIDSSEKMLTRAQKRVNGRTQARARLELDVAKTTLFEGDAALSEDKKDEALSRFSSALRSAIDTQAFISARAAIRSRFDREENPSEDVRAGAAMMMKTATATGMQTTSITATSTESVSTTTEEQKPKEDKKKSGEHIDIELDF